MTDWILGVIALLVLIACGVPIAFGMPVAGAAGLILALGREPALAMLGEVFYDNGVRYTLSVMPLFVLTGNFVVKAGLADDLYTAVNAWLRHYRGVLAMATVIACGGF